MQRLSHSRERRWIYAKKSTRKGYCTPYRVPKPLEIV
nr:MAG TPA: hypothetical protein [Caudoviricetes sp.]